MTASVFMKFLFASLCYHTGIVAWKLRQIPGFNFAILMYHRVIPGNEVRNGVQAGMYVQLETFERHIEFLKKYFSVVPVSEVSSEAKSRSFTSHDKPRCVLTFDDGWYDFYEYAFPILKTYQIPATVFLPTNFIGTENWFRTDRLALLFSNDPILWIMKRHVRQTIHL